MTPELKKYFESQIDMFASDGWKHFEEQVKDMKASTDRISGVSMDDVRFKQGELSIIDWILGWPASVQREYEAQSEEWPSDANV